MPLIAPGLARPFATLDRLPAPARAQVATLLRRRLADAIDLRFKLGRARRDSKGFATALGAFGSRIRIAIRDLAEVESPGTAECRTGASRGMS